MGCDSMALSPHYCLAEGGDRSRGGSSTIQGHFNSENEPNVCNKCLEHLFPTSKSGNWGKPFPLLLVLGCKGRRKRLQGEELIPMVYSKSYFSLGKRQHQQRTKEGRNEGKKEFCLFHL